VVLSPEALNGIIIHLRILADEGEGVVYGLGDEESIEGITVMKGQGEIDF
jgi:hypothetical protein